MEFKNITELNTILSQEEKTKAASNVEKYFRIRDEILCSSFDDGEEFLIEVDVDTLK